MKNLKRRVFKLMILISDRMEISGATRPAPFWKPRKGVECRNSCNTGYRLHGNSPAVKKCICRSKIGCKWIKGLRAKCRRIPGARIENEEPQELLKSCVAIENGKKKLTRNQNCSCPPGWSIKDKARFHDSDFLVEYWWLDCNQVNIIFKIDISALPQ